MFGEKNTLHSSLRIFSHLWNMVVVVSWLGPVMLHLGQDSLPSLMEQWILNYTSNSKGKCQDICLRTESQENVMQQDNNPKHTSHSTKELLKKNKVNVLEWLSQSPDLNPIKILWKDLSKQFMRKPTNITEFKWFFTKEWAKTPTLLCRTDQYLQETYLQLLQPKGVTPDTENKRFTYFCNAQICNTG